MRQDNLRSHSLTGEICVNGFDRLMRVDNFDLPLFDDFSKLSDNAKIYRQTTLQPYEFNARSFEIFLKRAAARCRQRQIQIVGGGIAADI
jgi:hypothetical protein